MSDKLNEAVKKIMVAVKEAEKIAEEEKSTFTLDISYGMGGTYYPPSDFMTYDELLKAIEEGNVSAADAQYALEEFERYPYKKNSYVYDIDNKYMVSKDETGWRSSSSMC